MENVQSEAIEKESRNLSVLIWGLTILFGFIPGLIFYLTKKDDSYIYAQAKESLNWSITSIIAYIVGTLLSFFIIGLFVILAVGIAHLVFCIMGMLATSKGKNFRVPFMLRLLK